MPFYHDSKKRIRNLVFPEGIRYNRENDDYRNTRINLLFSTIPYLTGLIEGCKNGDSDFLAKIPTWSVRMAWNIELVEGGCGAFIVWIRLSKSFIHEYPFIYQKKAPITWGFRFSQTTYFVAKFLYFKFGWGFHLQNLGL